VTETCDLVTVPPALRVVLRLSGQVARNRTAMRKTLDRLATLVEE
jgi:hypothetical protein